jgi:hypothetical protein
MTSTVWADESDPAWLAGWLEYCAWSAEPDNDPDFYRSRPTVSAAARCAVVSALADLLVADLLFHPPGTV